MTIEPLVPDAARAGEQRTAPNESLFGGMVQDLAAVLGKAERAENAFASGAGDLQTATYERARADVALAVATAAAQRAAQALQSILTMQV